ncbi:unnamed protein product [Eruca vesicaria subsp. sativa]|uniref:Uncharacterized protein n=1 Tax=Eruca vesicaria subsp. sativa TaxID=29727 RepID=A0ABC8LSF8_ERUVS|nr:unnamed protein product [Eruca vesicaria subsp. sativa]
MADGEKRGGDSSSEEEDPKWKAAINSIVTTTAYATKLAATQQSEDGDFRIKPKKLTHAQIKVKKLLNEMVENTLDFVKDPVTVPEDEHEPENDCGVRLFKRCSTGIIFDHVDELQGPKKRPKLRPDRGAEGSSKEFKKRIKSIAVDGSDVLSAAMEAAKKASARLEGKEAAAKAKAKKEEERVAELKKVRGEKWLPSVARALQLNKNSTSRSPKS